MSDNPPEVDRVVYHHVGTGHTTSVHFCVTCDGWYGVPHADHDHQRFREDCACRPCQEMFGHYPKGGVMMTHAAYLAMRASSGEKDPHTSVEGEGGSSWR